MVLQLINSHVSGALDSLAYPSEEEGVTSPRESPPFHALTGLSPSLPARLLQRGISFWSQHLDVLPMGALEDYLLGDRGHFYPLLAQLMASPKTWCPFLSPKLLFEITQWALQQESRQPLRSSGTFNEGLFQGWVCRPL